MIPLNRILRKYSRSNKLAKSQEKNHGRHHALSIKRKMDVDSNKTIKTKSQDIKNRIWHRKRYAQNEKWKK